MQTPVGRKVNRNYLAYSSTNNEKISELEPTWNKDLTNLNESRQRIRGQQNSKALKDISSSVEKFQYLIQNWELLKNQYSVTPRQNISKSPDKFGESFIEMKNSSYSTKENTNLGESFISFHSKKPTNLNTSEILTVINERVTPINKSIEKWVSYNLNAQQKILSERKEYFNYIYNNYLRKENITNRKQSNSFQEQNSKSQKHASSSNNIQSAKNYNSSQQKDRTEKKKLTSRYGLDIISEEQREYEHRTRLEQKMDNSKGLLQKKTPNAIFKSNLKKLPRNAKPIKSDRVVKKNDEAVKLRVAQQLMKLKDETKKIYRVFETDNIGDLQENKLIDKQLDDIYDIILRKVISNKQK